MNGAKAKLLRKYAERKARREFWATLQALLEHVRALPFRQRLRFAWMVTFGRPHVMQTRPARRR